MTKGRRTKLSPEAHASSPEPGSSPEPVAGTDPEGSQSSSERGRPIFPVTVSTLRPACSHFSSQTCKSIESERIGTHRSDGFKLSHHSQPRKLMILHFVDESSKYHTANILRQARCSTYSDLGNCDAKELIAAISEWARYMAHPSCLHVDEGMLFPFR